ncbi:hypothetical protein ACHAPG_005806 [Botrytis cinerea]
MSLLKVSSISDDDGTKSVKVGAVVVEVSNVELIIPVVDGQRVWLAPEFDDSANPVLLVGLVPIGSVPGEMPVGDAAGSMMEEYVVKICGVIVAIESDGDEPFPDPEALREKSFESEALGDEPLPLFLDGGEGTVVIGTKLLGPGVVTEGRADELNIEELIGTVDRVAIIVEEIVDSGKRAVLESAVELSYMNKVVMLKSVVDMAVDEAKGSMLLDKAPREAEGAILLNSAEENGVSVGMPEIPVSDGVSIAELDVERATESAEVLVLIKIDEDTKEVDCGVLRKTSEVPVLVDEVKAETEVPDSDKAVLDSLKGNVMVVVVVLGGNEAVIHSIVVLVARGFDSEGRI